MATSLCNFLSFCPSRTTAALSVLTSCKDVNSRILVILLMTCQLLSPNPLSPLHTHFKRVKGIPKQDSKDWM